MYLAMFELELYAWGADYCVSPNAKYSFVFLEMVMWRYEPKGLSIEYQPVCPFVFTNYPTDALCRLLKASVSTN